MPLIGPYGGAGVGGALTNPTLPSRSASAPQQQMNLWQKFSQRLKDDPNLRMSLLTTGLNMLRSPKAGESGFDTFADAATQGVGTLDQLRQRDIQTGRDDRTEERQERNVSSVERRTDIAATGVEDRRAQHKANLDEDKRQFDARLEAGGFSGTSGAGSTGPERMATLAEEAFIASGMYPDTEQGRSLARLRAQGAIGNSLVTPQDRFDYAAKLAADMALFDQESTPEELTERATAITNSLADRFNQADPSTPQPEPGEITGQDFTGRPGANPNNPEQAGTLAPGVQSGTWVIEFPDGTISGEMTEAQALQALRAGTKAKHAANARR